MGMSRRSTWWVSRVLWCGALGVLGVHPVLALCSCPGAMPGCRTRRLGTSVGDSFSALPPASCIACPRAPPCGPVLQTCSQMRRRRRARSCDSTAAAWCPMCLVRGWRRHCWGVSLGVQQLLLLLLLLLCGRLLCCRCEFGANRAAAAWQRLQTLHTHPCITHQLYRQAALLCASSHPSSAPCLAPHAVPFEQVQTHIVNLPIKEMDLYLPG